MVKPVAWGPFDQRMLMGLGWVGSFPAFFTSIEKKVEGPLGSQASKNVHELVQRS